VKTIAILIIGLAALVGTCEARHIDPVPRLPPRRPEIVFTPDFAPFKRKAPHRYTIRHCHRHPGRVCHHRRCK
jgi:hypothetical protein